MILPFYILLINLYFVIAIIFYINFLYRIKTIELLQSLRNHRKRADLVKEKKDIKDSLSLTIIWPVILTRELLNGKRKEKK